MESLNSLLLVLVHFDQYLESATLSFGFWIYLILFLIIFAETGLVVTPFLPGDSLLFAAGALAAQGLVNIWLLATLLLIAGILGDATNYWIGRSLGARLFQNSNSRFFNQRYLARTHAFYERYGNKTVFLSRFIPIVRTFAPFVAGLGHMHYGRFTFYNITGAVTWIVLFLFGGFAFGNMPIVRENFSLVILGIIIVSLLPALYEFLKVRFVRSRRQGELPLSSDQNPEDKNNQPDL